ncbi:MAG: hypothetical protein AB7K68_14220 [Bacteriovoracia bacterium]
MNGFVYILENREANRIKIGMTINKVEERLLDVNRKWLGISGTCQICGSRRLVDDQGYIPAHPVSGKSCSGSKALSFEKDVELAKSYLTRLKESKQRISGVEKNSTTRRITTLEKRIEQFSTFSHTIGTWSINTAFYTNRAEDVELQSHEILASYLDNSATIGEVFNCTAPEATGAVELVLNRMGLIDSAKKLNVDNSRSNNNFPLSYDSDLSQMLQSLRTSFFKDQRR